jgi:hypothetical protein
MAVIRVRVGAQLEPGAVAIFQPLIAAAKQARAKIGSEGAASGAEFVGGYRTAPAAARAAGDAVVAATQQTAARVTAVQRRAAAEREKIDRFNYNFKKRLIEEEARDAERALAKRSAFVKQIGGGALSTFGGMASRGVGFAGSIARGAGVDLDVGSLTRKVSTAQKTATDISNSAYMEGRSGAAGQRQDPAKLIAEARAVADSAAMDTNDALLGLQKFVAKTSDLATGRAILGDMAKLAKVTGASLEDMVDAAGDVSKNLGDIPDNAEKTRQIMTIVAQQGKLGSVEIKDLASQMAKVAAGSGKFSGGMDNAIIALGAMAQTSRGTGGSASAAQAATSVASFVTDLTSKAGQKALASGGVNVWADKGRTTMKPVQEIIKEILAATHGDLARVSTLVPGKQSGRAFGGFAKIYNEAERKEKGSGLAAVDAEFKRLTATLSKAEINESLARVTNTTESKVQRFNNQLERIAEEAAGKVLPALESLGPVALRAVGGLANLAVYVAENPVKAAFAGLGVAIGKEVAAAGIKAAINNALAGQLGGLTIATATIAIAAATIAMREKSEAATTEAIDRGKSAAAALQAGIDAGAVTRDQQVSAEQAYQILQAKTANAGVLPGQGAMEMVDKYGGPLGDLLKPIIAYNAVIGSGVASAVTGGKYGTSFQEQSQQGVDLARIGELKAEMAAVKASLDRLATSNLKVTVTNQPGSPVGPGATGTRTGPDAH